MFTLTVNVKKIKDVQSQHKHPALTEGLIHGAIEPEDEDESKNKKTLLHTSSSWAKYVRARVESTRTEVLPEPHLQVLKLKTLYFRLL